MVSLLITVGLGPALMVASSLAARRSGPRLGGIVAAFPAIVGPLLLVTVLEHGVHSGARAASGALVGGAIQPRGTRVGAQARPRPAPA